VESPRLKIATKNFHFFQSIIGPVSWPTIPEIGLFHVIDRHSSRAYSLKIPCAFHIDDMFRKLISALRKSPPALLVLVLGLGVVFALWQYAAGRSEQKAREQFILHAGDVQHSIRERLATQIDILRGAQGLFAASGEVTRAEWRRYVGALKLGRFPGVQGIGFIRYVPGAEKTDFEHRVQRDASLESSGYPDFSIFPAGKRDAYYPVEYFEPVSPGLKVLGLDHGAYAIGREALERARDTGLPAASGMLVSETDRGHEHEPRFMLVLPVYRQGKPQTTVEERRAALLGFVYARHTVGGLIHNAIGATLLQELKFEVFDGGAIGQAVGEPDHARLLYSTDDATASRTAFRPRFSTESRLEVAGREWVVRFSSIPDSQLGAPDSTLWLIFLGGILLSFAAFAIILILSTERWREAEEMRRQKSLISQVLDALPINIFMKDKDWRFVMVNEQCARLFGVPKEAVVGKSDFDVFPQDVARSLRAYDEEVRAANGMVMREEKLVSGGKEVFALAGKTMITLAGNEEPLLLGFSIDITERKRMESALRESEERFRSILDNSPSVIFVKDLEGRYLLANREHARLVGIDNAKIVGKTDYDCFPKKSADSYRENDRQVLASGSATEFEESVPQGDDLHTYLSVKFPLRNANGEPYAICGISTDITSRLRLEREAAKAHANQLSRALTDAVGEGLVGVDMWHQIVFANPKAQALLGVDEADMLGKKLGDVIRAATAEGDLLTDTTCPAWARVAGGQIFQTDDWSFSRSDGSRFPAGAVIAPIFDNGYVTGSVLSFQDITRRKRVEAALARSEHQQKAFLDNLPEFAWFKDSDGRYVMVNEAVGKACGVAPEEMVGKTDFEFWPQELAEAYRADDRAVMASGEQKCVEEPFEDRDGTRTWIETVKSPVYDEDGRIIGTVGSARNITERKRAEEELMRHVAELARMNAELDEFTYVASHDLQEPLRKLVAFSDWLRRDLGEDLPERAARDVEFITDAANRMQSLVRDLLTLSRTGKTSMVRECIELDDTVDRALNALALRIQDSGAEIVRDPLPQVWGDPTLLTQLYQNLISNAIKFVDHPPPRIYLTAEHLNGEWVFGVKDSGIGIKPEYAKEIFKPFKRLHGRGEYEGSGIGLAVCRKVIERHKGRIWVESEEGFGAHFKFVLQAQ